MISERDVEFHTPPDADHHWAETNMFNFHLPEAGVHVTMYNCFRKGLGEDETGPARLETAEATAEPATDKTAG